MKQLSQIFIFFWNSNSICQQQITYTQASMLIYLSALLFAVTALRFTVYQGRLHKNCQHSISKDQNIQFYDQQQLASYHPHYMNSYSYPTPVTAHLFYGYVKNQHALFWLKDIINDTMFWHQKFSVNNQVGQNYKLAQQIKKQFVQSKRYIMVLQIQNALQTPINYTIQIKNNHLSYGIIVNYQNKTKNYRLYFSDKNEKILNISELVDYGVNHFIRDLRQYSAQNAWRISQSLTWKGNGRTQFPETTKIDRLILEIQLTDLQSINRKSDNVKVHFDEAKHIHAKNTNQRMQQLFSKKIQSIQVKNIQKDTIQKINDDQNCAADALSKLLSGLSYEYGTLQIYNGSIKIENQPKQLLSFSPSRTKFPWGFLWDDGFHCLVAAKSHPKLVLKIIKSWLNTMLDNGWIPRQQNRGKQRQYLCNCQHFMKKDLRDGNPPTLILALQFLRLRGFLNEKDFSKQYWNKLVKWHNWFMETLQISKDSYLFKWKDSIAFNGSYTSGMDDFPRMKNVKCNVDLQSWIYFFTAFMQKAYLIYQSNITEKNPYTKMLIMIKVKSVEFIDPTDNIPKDFDTDGNFNAFLGYPNLLPLAFGMLEYKSLQFNATVDLIKNRLNTTYGISSIDMHSKLYLQNQNAYWRGPVWININFIVLQGLYKYYPEQKNLYESLRKDLLKVVCDNWRNSGYFYENYINHKGSFGFPFNGWTSLISLIYSQEY